MKTRRFLRRLLPVAALAAGLSVSAGAAQAQATYLITLDTSSLNTAAYTGPFVLDFQFVDGDGFVTGTPDVNNWVTISDFQGGTGFSATAVTLADGTPSGTPPTGETQVGFMPGTTLSFLTSLTTNEDQMIPDAFSVAILNNGIEIPTQDTFGNSNGSFVTISESSDPTAPAALDVATFDTPNSEFTPIVTLVAPEPSGGVTLAVGLATGVLAVCVRRRLSKAAPSRS